MGHQCGNFWREWQEDLSYLRGRNGHDSEGGREALIVNIRMLCTRLVFVMSAQVLYYEPIHCCSCIVRYNHPFEQDKPLGVIANIITKFIAMPL